MEISRPLLPPKKGYVEAIDENGNRYYKPIQSKQKELDMEKDISDLKSFTNVLSGESTEGSQTALELHKVVQLFAESISDEATMMAIPSIYPMYKIGVSYKIGNKFRYGLNSVGDFQLYQVLQDHTSSAEWTPDSAISLYKKIGISDDGTPIWVQPLGATDAYSIGDVVLYNGKKYESVINANVWSPDVYPAGWKEVNSEEVTVPEPEPEEPDITPEEPEETIPEWVQPTGVTDAYNIGDVVLYNGKKYESVINANVWSPDAYPAGWKAVE